MQRLSYKESQKSSRRLLIEVPSGGTIGVPGTLAAGAPSWSFSRLFFAIFANKFRIAWIINLFCGRIMAGKKKNIPKLDRENLYAAFGVEPEDGAKFSEELEKDLTRQDLKAVLREKAGRRKKLSLRERLKSYPPPQEELDLHGFTGSEAERMTEKFIRQTAALKYRTVRIITGKGLHSNGPAVLPEVVEIKLKELQIEKRIFAFAWEKKDKHRSGAVLVYL